MSRERPLRWRRGPSACDRPVRPGFELLRQIGAELGAHWSTVSQELPMPASSCVEALPPPPASTEQIVERRNRGLSWTMTWSRSPKQIVGESTRLGGVWTLPTAGLTFIGNTPD